MYSTSSFYIGTIRAAVEEYQSRHGGFGDLRVIPSHIGSDFTAQGYAESELDGVIFEVSYLACKLEEKRQARFARQAALRERLERGEISFEEWENEYIFSF